MKLHFRDQPFSFRAAPRGELWIVRRFGIGEVFATAHRIHEDDLDSWNLEWSHVAERIETLAKVGNMTLPHQVLFDWLGRDAIPVCRGVRRHDHERQKPNNEQS